LFLKIVKILGNVIGKLNRAFGKLWQTIGKSLVGIFFIDPLFYMKRGMEGRNTVVFQVYNGLGLCEKNTKLFSIFSCVEYNIINTLFMKMITSTIVCLLWLGYSNALAQNMRLMGQLLQLNGSPLPGVYVRIVGTNSGTSTDVDGKYQVSAPAEASLFSFIG
jgi:hypothetical protein